MPDELLESVKTILHTLWVGGCGREDHRVAYLLRMVEAALPADGPEPVAEKEILEVQPQPTRPTRP